MARYALRPVRTKSDLKDFLRVPYRVYRDDPHWVAPLLIEREEHLSPKNPYFAHAETAMWTAWADGAPVGRISAQIDALHVERYGPQGHFGFLEGVEDPELFAALTGQAEAWLAERGMTAAVGPASFSVNDEYGLLVDGFDAPDMMLMNHARPYYGPYLEAAGYAPAKDLLAYLYRLDEPMPRMCQRLAARADADPRVTLRRFDMKRLREEIGVIVDIFNDAWSDNWGFVPMTTEEVDHMAAQMKPLLRPELAWIAELDGKPAAMIVALPNLHEALEGLGGRLAPFGALKLLWRLKVSGLKTARVLMMGVRRELQDTVQAGTLAYALIEKLGREGRRIGLEAAELSWILEDNTRMVRIAETGVGAPYKRYRVYQKSLA